MSPTETARILAVIAAAYPRFEVNEITHSVWSEMLGDLEYVVVNDAVRRHICTSRFAPTIAEIREQATGDPDALTAAEAWGELMSAVKRHGYYHETEALNSLPYPVARIAGMIGWREINLCTEVDVLRGQFLRMYQQVAERMAREDRLPAQLRSSGTAGDLERIGLIAGQA